MSKDWFLFQKLNLSSFVGSLKAIYSDSDEKLLLSDIFSFYVIPFLLAGIYWYFASSETNLQSIYTSVAFLAGFVFSAFIVLINLIDKINELQPGPMKVAMKKNTKELALISILVFLFGILIVFCSFLDSVLSQANFNSSINLAHLIRSFAVAIFFTMLMHLIMIAKRLFVILVTS